METITNQEPHEQVIQNGNKILADNEDYQSMVINVNPISAQVKGATIVTLNEKQKNKYSFLNVDVPNMLKEVLKDKLIWLPKMKRPREVNR
ncbi:hypothetical protein Goshw_000846, partial [Gossypium schwendimanii]|nr:hypothetical protein [Gossypium schwendimanii]